MNIFFKVTIFVFCCIPLYLKAEVNNNGLLCKNTSISKLVGFWFEDNHVKRFDMVGKKVKMKLYVKYSLYGPNKITWINDGRNSIVLNRKKLTVTNYESCEHIISKKLLFNTLNTIAKEENKKNIF